ncbi:protein kinase domain-containing protein [Pseudoalteromonas luteoviolacea]|uniref:Serine/threonine protein kinase n=1 Tax=Pseudoalteromonas luteoviolacea S4054 TaxID=1129367 RepID=A0A0F6ABG5_9GAMM|nr:serine/threonine protein kinase [Pseudoalteromonas luteoviolacea]AOT08493.1 serine/threonine protein kinase [Pseudoalteromonas luteoviolacea]AOT13409.1 serine/threonine protein kinase [Pseudoalteromonas luteoviolacea]AOT18322.1 serine/threonine protein kinase [Pseudoalteromonas luteoviolacea]KKE83510.1 serine/threonine protein kinase [Pseudoalteromonas luteoviolacea S4054]KZN75947.1 serine/threonine protein kinase [Pseudoalteromonas luteoviolacea S4047-1]
MSKQSIHNFYINEQQSIYLLSHHDAKKHRQWLNICKKQLSLLGYQDVELIGSGAFGFVFAGVEDSGAQWVFKFSRITLAQSVRDRLEDEAYMLSQINNPMVPEFFAFERVKKQGILMMARAQGEDLEQISLKQGRLKPRVLVHLALKLRNVLLDLRERKNGMSLQPVVHGDIKPSNIVWDQQSDAFSLVDWGSSVYAQIDVHGEPVASNIMDLMSSDIASTNARMGDVYFIGDEQMSGSRSSPRFDEQGVASTIYALASAQSCRFGAQVIPATSLGLPIEFSRVIDGMLSKDKAERDAAGDYFMRNMPAMAKVYLPDIESPQLKANIPFWTSSQIDLPDTVVYSSRKQFLRRADHNQQLLDVNDAQLDRYYKEFLFDTGDTEKAFLASISRLAKYPVVGGLSFHWQQESLFVESSLMLHDDSLQSAFTDAVNATVMLAQGIEQKGLFKCCLFDARQTIQLERDETGAYIFEQLPELQYSVSHVAASEVTRPHSYFEDGKDPDEQLQLPKKIIQCVFELNKIHHTGCIIFESLSDRLKIHYYYRLLDAEQESAFAALLKEIIQYTVSIQDYGVAGFMKLPYKNTREFELCPKQPDNYFPKNPKS